MRQLLTSQEEEINAIYMRSMLRSDALRVCRLHEEQHGVSGMLGSLDCSHVGWKNCPVAWQGQYDGKEDKPTIVMEAMCDYNVWFWHVVFGFPGTLNDINIWDRSPLLAAFVDGSFASQVDHKFTIAGKAFHRLWMLVDGIYPELCRFVKNIQQPVNDNEKSYNGWQEGARKDIERAFGVLQNKFRLLKKDVENWYLDDIKDIVMCVVLLHNMMVKVRMERGEDESMAWYDEIDNTMEDENTTNLDVDADDLEQEEATAMLQLAQEAAYYQGEAARIIDVRRERMWCTIRQRMAQKQWEKLYDQVEHYQLKDAIFQQVTQTGGFQELAEAEEDVVMGELPA